MNILVSACLLGAVCRYDGTGCADARVLRLAEKHGLVPVCPEQLGGLPTPRPPVELVGGRAVARDGADYTAQFEKGAREAARLAEILRCPCAVLKNRSPSCGCGTVYDGTFSGRLTAGSGITAKKLLEAGVSVYNEENCAGIEKDAEKSVLRGNGGPNAISKDTSARK